MRGRVIRDGYRRDPFAHSLVIAIFFRNIFGLSLYNSTYITPSLRSYARIDLLPPAAFLPVAWSRSPPRRHRRQERQRVTRVKSKAIRKLTKNGVARKEDSGISRSVDLAETFFFISRLSKNISIVIASRAYGNSKKK